MFASLSVSCASSDPTLSPDTDGEQTPDDDDTPPAEDDGDEAPLASKDAGRARDASVPRDAAPPAVQDAGSKADASTPASADAGAKDAGAEDASKPQTGGGACCDDGDCLCHGDVPDALSTNKGPYKTATYTISTGTVHYPTDAEPPFAAVALCGGFTNTGPEMADWGPFYASYGIVTVITTTTGLDDPGTRGVKLLAAIAELKKENDKSGGTLAGKLAGRYGTSGYSMGGGGTTLASGDDATLKTSVGLAPWGPSGTGVKVPTLLLCGSSDTTAPCSMAQGAYGQIPNDTPKMMATIAGATHFNWFGPTQAGRGASGQLALAFQKVYLEGDTRWKDLLTSKVASATVTTNIQ